MGHEVVERVGPDGLPSEWHRDGGVVGEELVRHHLELPVGADQEAGRPHACVEFVFLLQIDHTFLSWCAMQITKKNYVPSSEIPEEVVKQIFLINFL